MAACEYAPLVGREGCPPEWAPWRFEKSMPDPCEVQPLSINHYMGPLSTCMSKASKGISRSQGYLNQRVAHICQEHYLIDRSANNGSVGDTTVARHADVSCKHAYDLFGTLNFSFASREICTDGYRSSHSRHAHAPRKR